MELLLLYDIKPQMPQLHGSPGKLADNIRSYTPSLE